MDEDTPMARTDDVAQAMLDTVRAALADVPHADVAPGSLRMQWGSGTTPKIVLRVKGWGPTLHMRDLEWRQDLGAAVVFLEEHEAGVERPAFGPGLDEHLSSMQREVRMLGHMTGFTVDRLAQAFAHVLVGVVDVQRRLAAHAASLGIEAPLPHPRTALHATIGHLHVSEALVQHLLATHDPGFVVAQLRSLVTDCVRQDMGTRDDRIDLSSRAGAGFDHGADASGATPHIWRKAKIGPVEFDGTTVELPAVLPDSVMAAAIGRPVGDVVATGLPALDALIVRDVYVDAAIDACDLTVEPDLVRIDRITALRAHLGPG
jgi:hypothetical protein